MTEPRDLTPSAIVSELDRYIVGQAAAKRAVAIALRNRWRRFRVSPELRDEVMPKNIILVGPTGVERRRSRAGWRSSRARRSSRSRPRSSPRSVTSAATWIR